MATILPRRRADGTVGYMATIRLHSGNKLIHRETKTFSRRATAEKWARAREVELEDPSAFLRAQEGDVTLASLVRWYIDNFQDVSKWQRTKQAQLEFLEKHPIGTLNALSLTSATLIDHVRSRRAKGAGPATVSNDLTWIGVVLRAAKSIKELPVAPAIVEEARTACRELRLLAKSRRRERRPTTQELVKYIFPYDPRSIGAAFTRACRVLGIDDLRFHDLRHEATSRLFERGYQIHEVSQFTIHESWNELKRYTNLRPEKVREIPDAVTQTSAPSKGNGQARKRGRATTASAAVDQ